MHSVPVHRPHHTHRQVLGIHRRGGERHLGGDERGGSVRIAVKADLKEVVAQTQAQLAQALVQLDVAAAQVLGTLARLCTRSRGKL